MGGSYRGFGRCVVRQTRSIAFKSFSCVLGLSLFSNALAATAESHLALSDQYESLATLSEEKVVPYRQRLLKTPFGDIPALWGIETVGADLANAAIKAEWRPEKATVVVSDSGVLVGAAEHYEIPKPVVRRIKLGSIPVLGRYLPEELKDQEVPHWENWFVSPGHPFHGTHVAGTIGAESDQEFAVSEFSTVASANIFQGRQAYKEDLFLTGIRQAASRAPRGAVMNMSHGIVSHPEIINGLRSLIAQKDMILVAAAGNEGASIEASKVFNEIPEMVVVGAYGFSGTTTFFSNHGRPVDIVAPGELILSRSVSGSEQKADLSFLSGTSMAAPHVSATFASLRALLPKARSKDLQTIVFKTAIDLGAKGRDSTYGHGLLNTFKAVKVALRLKRLHLTTREAIQYAVQLENTFDFGTEVEWARQRVVEAKTFSSRFQALREVALLASDASEFQPIGDLYASIGLLPYGFGYTMAALNREGVELTEESTVNVAPIINVLQFRRLKENSADLTYFLNFANADLLLASYRALPAEAWELFGLFRIQILKVDSSRVLELEQIAFQKIQEVQMKAAAKKAAEEAQKASADECVADGCAP